MKKTVEEIVFGKNSLVSGLIALSIICGIGLGCFCNKDKFDFSNLSTPSPTPSASASPSPSATKSYTKADASKAQIPSEDELQVIVKKTLLDFNDGLQKEDFTDFHASVSKAWQRQTTPERMKSNFQTFIDGDADLSPIRSMSAKFTRSAEITKSTGVKTLETEGEYPTTPITSTFKLKYIADGKEWKLASLEVVTKITRKN